MKMKKAVTPVLVLTVAFGTASFTTPVKKNIDAAKSSIEWTGKKVLGSHNGTINFQEGYLQMDGDQIVGGMFVVDMSSIKVTDLEGEMRGKLEGHLRSDDFFGIANHPTSNLKIKNATQTAEGVYKVNAEITIKGTTEPLNFVLNKTESGATATLKIDRTKFGVRYGSGSFFDNLGDNTISDTFELNVNIVM